MLFVSKMPKAQNGAFRDEAPKAAAVRSTAKNFSPRSDTSNGQGNSIYLSLRQRRREKGVAGRSPA